MNFIYHLREDVVIDSINQKRSVYGIEVLDSSHAVIKSIPNVFSDKDRAEAAVALFNNENLSPEHLEDAIDDMLSELYGIF